MTDVEIRSNNVTIAIFMDNWTDHGQEPAYAVYNHKGYEAWELKYHESWDWLMPVVKKIREFYSTAGAYDKWFERMRNDLVDTNISKIYFSCIEFINWYNDRSK